MPKYKIRYAENSDVQSIARLRTGIKEFVPVSAGEYVSFWEHLIRDNPCGIQKTLVAVDDRKDIVAHYTILPFRFMKDDTPLLGGFLCQLMIDEEYRKELVFPRMEMKFLKEYKKLGYDFAFSLGNRANVVKAHLSFGFTKLGELPVYAKPYRLSKIAPRIIKNRALELLARPFLFAAEKLLRLRKPPGAKGISVTEASSFGQETDSLFMDLKRFFPYCAARDSATLNWRFGSSAGNRYRILIARSNERATGYAVIRHMKMKEFDVLAVVDILFSPEDADTGKALMRAVHDAAVELKTDMSSCMLNPDDPLLPAFKASGYFRTPEVFSLFTHEPKTTEPSFTPKSFSKWHLTWFDNDAV